MLRHRNHWKTWSLRLRFCFLASVFFARPGVGEVPPVPPPVFPSIDENGVHLALGAFNYSQTDLVIGPPESGGLAFTRHYQSAPIGGWTHNHVGYITSEGLTCTVVLGLYVETFESSYSDCRGSFTSNQQRGSTLSYNINNTIYTLTLRDGTAVEFRAAAGVRAWINSLLTDPIAYLISIKSPNGDVTDYTYLHAQVCFDPPLCWNTYTVNRLWHVQNNLGYRLVFEYPDSLENLSYLPSKIYGINTAIEYCNGQDCTQNWPTATYSYGMTQPYKDSVTNSFGQTVTYTHHGRISQIAFSGTNRTINVAYAGGRVSSVNLGYGAWSYSYSEGGGKRTTVVTNPDATSRSYVSNLSSGRIESVTDELGNTTSYTYDNAGRADKVTFPEGNRVEYSYDGRGNILEINYYSKGGAETFKTKASYPASCASPRTCNKPLSTTDANGKTTSYTYDSAHGGVTSITSPPDGNGQQRTTHLTYSQLQASYKGANGQTTGSAVWRLTSSKTCTVLTDCDDSGPNLQVTEIGYNSSMNLLPSSTTLRSGDSSVVETRSVQYTDWGDVQVEVDTLGNSSSYYYGEGRRLVGMIGPDPDGGGPMLPRAMRMTYNAAGLLSVVERGTVSPGDPSFSTFAALEKHETVYDSYDRPVLERRSDGATIVAVTQQNYDSRGRILCIALRMNPVTFTSPVSDACQRDADGAFGPDRITKYTYDATGKVLSEKAAYGTNLEQDLVRYTYTPNGQVNTLTDARGYRTTYEYDGFDRLTKLRYPRPTATGQSSTTDYESFQYDNAGQVVQERRRDGSVFNFTYDNLGRVIKRTAPGSQPDLYLEYDLMGNVRKAETKQGSTTLHTITTVYDALSRVTSETSSELGAVQYEYDAGGRRSKMKYPGPGDFFITYTYNNLGELTSILQKGSQALANFAYDGLGRRTSMSLGNGAVTSYSYDAASRLETLVKNPAGSSHDATIGFLYNPAGQITARTPSNPIYNWALPSEYIESYSGINGLNQYTSARGMPLVYDERGNLTQDGSKGYTYDYDNKLVTASGGVSLDYDPMGRLHKVAGAATTRFLYDGQDVIAEYNAAGTVLRRYVHGPGIDEPLVWYEGSGTSNRRWFLADERGSVVGIANNSGSVTQVNKYDPFGVPDTANDGRFQYTGQMWIEELGLYHYKARAYHPRLGRFLQPDPIGYAGGMNVYGYVGNDPINARDPLGLQEAVIDNFRQQHCNQMSGMCTPVPVMEELLVVYRLGVCDFACQFRRDFQLSYALSTLSAVAQDGAARTQGLDQAQSAARGWLRQFAGRIDFQKDDWQSPDDVAMHVLPKINHITFASGVELGGYIISTSKGFGLYPEIFIGTFTQVPDMSGPAPNNAIAGFHAHPTQRFFSHEDVAWANERMMLYLINPQNEIRLCIPGAITCDQRRGRSGNLVR